MPASTLNPEQLDAVNHGEGPLLIIAGAGTGKTTVITERVKHLIVDKEVDPTQILALTFTEKASREMEERIDIALPYGYTQLWVSTFHAFCDRVLREEAVSIGLNPAYKLATESEAMLFLRKNLHHLNLDYFRPLGNPYKFIQGMLQHFSRLKDDDITPADYAAYAEKLMSNAEADMNDVKKARELAGAFRMYEELKAKEGIMDFSDLNANVLKLLRTRSNVLKYYQDKFKYILVDEFQDTNYAQNELALLLSDKSKNITVVGDDDQCLPGDTHIATEKGSQKIKAIAEGDTVLTGVGKGYLGHSKVTKIFKQKKTGIFVTIHTRGGYILTATANHKMFCYLPKKVEKKTLYYVYLMHRRNLGWRLGMTNDLAVRLKLERSADAIIALRAFKTEEEARFHETVWSLRYQLPTCVFKERQNVMMQGDLVQRLYKEFDTEENAKRLTKDLGISLSDYHYTLNAVTRGASQQVNIYVTMCYRNYRVKNTHAILQNPLVAHQVTLETSHAAVIEALQKAKIPYKKAKKGIRVRRVCANLTAADNFAKELAQITNGFIQIRSYIGTLNTLSLPAVVLPAGNLVEGCYVPVMRDNHLFYDEIVSLTKEEKTETVYDLEVERSHNFIANGIAVHNSIYRWRGAALANIMQFREHFPNAKTVALTKNYRSTAEVLNKSYTLVQNNNPDRLEVKEHINKKLEAMRGVAGDPVELLFGARVENEAEQVVEKIKELIKKKKYTYSDFAILVRANDHSQPFARALERAQIPYQFLGPGHLFHQEEIKDLIAYLKVLANFEDSAAMYRVLTNEIWGIEARDIAAILNFANKKNLCLYEALERIDDTFLPEMIKEQGRYIVKMIKRHLGRIPRDSAGQILYYFFDDSGLLKKFLSPDTARAEKRAQNIAKFFEKLKSYEASHDDASVFAVVDWIDLAMELGESPLAADSDWGDMNAVNILTIHSSKGLEFPVVFVTNLVTQRFPTRERREQIPIPNDLIREELPEGDANLQEERRLFYVAMTRAKDNIYLTAANFYGEGKRERKLSPFIAETLGQEYVDTLLKRHKEKASVQQLSLLDVLPKPAINPEDEVALATGQTESLYPVNFLSYSQIQTFEQCPLHYKLKYILKIPPFPSPALSFGTSVHAVLRDYFHSVIKGEVPSPEALESMMKRNWIDEGFSSKSHEQSAYLHARDIIDNYVKEERASVPLATEIPFQFSIPGLKVGGRIDRVDKLEDGKIEIIDYKTGSNIPTERELAKNFQLTLYGLAAQEVRDEIFCKEPEEIVLTLFYIESNTRLFTSRKKEQLEEAKDILRQKADEISRSPFTCVGGMTCSNCEYNLICQTFAK